MARKRLATPLPKGVQATLTKTTLEVRAPGAARLTFFPLLPKDTEPTDIARDGTAKGATLRIAYPAAIRETKGIKGLLAVTRNKTTTYHWLTVSTKPRPGK